MLSRNSFPSHLPVDPSDIVELVAECVLSCVYIHISGAQSKSLTLFLFNNTKRETPPTPGLVYTAAQ